MKISNHARQRMKERCGFNRKAQERMAERAFNEGITHKQTKGRMHKWVTSLFFRNCNANNIRLFEGFAYVFCGETLVTVIQIPIDLRKDFRNMIKL